MNNKKGLTPLAIITTAVIAFTILFIMSYLATSQSNKAVNPVNNQINLINETLNQRNGGHSTSELAEVGRSFSEFTANNKACWFDKEQYIDYWSIFTDISPEKQTANTWINVNKSNNQGSFQIDTSKSWCVITVRPTITGVLGAQISIEDVNIVEQENIVAVSTKAYADFENAHKNKILNANAHIDTTTIIKRGEKLCFVSYVLDNHHVFNIDIDEIRRRAYQEILTEGETCEI